MNNTRPFQVDDPAYYISRLEAEHSAALQALCEQCADYTMIAEGEEVAPTAGEELLQSAPPGRSLDEKFIYGIFDRQHDLAGVLEGMRNYPEDRVWWIGLLMLAPQTRGGGLGRRIVESFFDHVRSEQGTAVMLGVVEDNQAAYSFWQQMGFELVRQSEPRTFGRKVQTVYVMRKGLN